MKKILAIVLLTLLVMTLTGCSTGKMDEQDILNSEQDNGMFFLVSKERFGFERFGYVIVDKTTRVMYWLSYGINNYGTLTMLVNPDGTPRIWEDIYDD